MENTQIKMKTLLGKDGEKLGKILRVDERSGYDDQIEYFYVIQYQATKWKKSIFELPMKSYPPKNVTADSVTLGLSEKAFEHLIKQYETERKIKAKNAKLQKASSTDKALAISFSGRL